MQLVLSLFPGADLLGRAFEAEGFCVVRGPDLLWGQDVRDYHVPAGRFDGIIGGPPCQLFSQANVVNSGNPQNMIPEFIRLVEEAAPDWAVMENVVPAWRAAPDWPRVTVRDWDCGGFTFRSRSFWFYGLMPAPRPVKRPGQPAYSVLASNWKNREKNSVIGRIHTQLDQYQAAELQGFPELPEKIRAGLPLPALTARSVNNYIVHLLGNGVPLAMGRYIARHVKAQTEGNPAESWQMTGLPLFATRPAAPDGGEE